MVPKARKATKAAHKEVVPHQLLREKRNKIRAASIGKIHKQDSPVISSQVPKAAVTKVKVNQAVARAI